MMFANKFDGIAFPGTPPKPTDSLSNFARISLDTPPEVFAGGGFEEEGSSS